MEGRWADAVWPVSFIDMECPTTSYPTGCASWRARVPSARRPSIHPTRMALWTGVFSRSTIATGASPLMVVLPTISVDCPAACC